MDDKLVLEEIARAGETNAVSLDLSYRGLTSLPAEIGQLIKLEYLHLHGNQLRNVPAELGQLTNLKHLDLQRNQLMCVPVELGQLTSLRQLWLNNNKLSSAPAEIGQLSGLTNLMLAGNQLTSVPAELARLTNLTALHLYNNRLESLPVELAQLVNLTELSLRGNQLTSLPAELGQLTNLTKLDVDNNRLTSIPIELGQLTNLTELRLQSNELTSVPAQLRKLTNLRTLRLDGNSIESPPAELIAQGAQAALHYFCDLAAKESDYLYEAKLLLVGEERAGKSSLAEALTNPNYLFGDKDSTHGIDIIRWIIPKQETGLPRDFRLNIWDFGGQAIYHSTHQFFLTKRSIYFLVTETRKDVRHEDLYYWLNVIELLGGSSPVVIVQNKCDQRGVGLGIGEYKDRFTNIVEPMQITSCTEPFKATIEGLREATRRIIKSKELLPDVGATLPKVWVDIREELERLRVEGYNYISYEEYSKICGKFGMDQKRSLFLSDCFHDLGVFLHFRDDLQLRKTIFLNFEWVTKAVYGVLDNEKVIAQNGEFDTTDLEHIWHEEHLKDMQAELLSLMRNEKFELCFDLGSGRFLAPKLLPQDEPENLHGFQSPSELKEPLSYEYRYAFMPKGIVTRLIVKLNKYIHQNTYWRCGVLLEFDNTRALVRERYFHRKITITLEGENKKELLGVIRQNIDEINRDFPNLHVTEMIPCICTKCRRGKAPQYYQLDRLRKRLRDGKTTVECDESYEELNVYELLGSVGSRSYRRRASREERRFCVALSFPGEQREFVEKVADYLGEEFGKDEVFYHNRFEAELAQPDLDVCLEDIYQNESYLIVAFLCAEYEKKDWCGLEWRVIKDMIKKGRASDIMLVRLDDAHIPGLLSIHGYVNAKDRKPHEIADLIVERYRVKQQDGD